MSPEVNADDDCNSVKEQLSRILDGDLAGAEAEAAVAHAELCESCRRQHRELQLIQQELLVLTKPADADLLRSRKRVLNAVFGERERGLLLPRPSPPGLWWQRLRPLIWQPALAVGFAALLVWVAPGHRRPAPVEAVVASLPAAAIRMPPSGQATLVIATVPVAREGAFADVDAGPGALVMRLDSGSRDEVPILWVVSAENQ